MCMYVVFVLRIRRQPRSTLFPYTTLCRSVGQELTADVFDGVAKVDVIGTSKGKGTAGVMKRHGFKGRSEEHTSELQSRQSLVCRLLLENTKTYNYISNNHNYYLL